MGYVYVFRVAGLRWFIRNYCGGEENVKDCTATQFCERFAKPFLRDHAVRGGTCLRRLLPSMFWDGTQQQTKYYISHAWGAPIMETLVTMERELGTNAAVWFDVFSHNQISTEILPAVWWSSLLHGTIGTCDEVVMIVYLSAVSDDKVSNSFFRLWCLYEANASIDNQRPFRIVFTPTSEQKLKSTVGLSKQLLSQSLGVNTAVCTNKKDRRMIIKQISPDVQRFNAVVDVFLKEKLRETMSGLDVYTPRRKSMSMRGHPSESQLLLDMTKTMSRSITKLNPEQQLISASRNGDATKVKELLQGGADPNSADAEQKSPLLHAAAGGHIEVVKTLMDGRADPSLRDRMHDSAMSAAARCRKFECVGTILAKLDASPQRWKIQRLLREPWATHTSVDLWIDVASTWPSGVRNEPSLRRSCLHHAVQRGRVDAVNKMLQFDEDLASSNYEQPLIWTAAYQGHLDVVKLLAEKGASTTEKARGIGPMEAAMEGLKAAAMSVQDLESQLDQGIGGTKPQGRSHDSIIDFFTPRPATASTIHPSPLGMQRH